MTGGKIPKWEAELWSYVSRGDGMRCPIYSHCPLRRKNNYCPDDSKESINQLIDSERFDSNYYCKWEIFGGPFKKVEMLAQSCLRKGKVRSPPVPTQLILLADEKHPISIHPLPLKAYHGAIWHLKEGWVIQLNDGETSADNRFTLFHEAFHILAHCRSTPVFRKRDTVQGCFNEMLADYFAICILMPRKWVQEKWVQVKDADTMAEMFDVPKVAMGLRLKTLHLI